MFEELVKKAEEAIGEAGLHLEPLRGYLVMATRDEQPRHINFYFDPPIASEISLSNFEIALHKLVSIYGKVVAQNSGVVTDSSSPVRWTISSELFDE